MACSVVLMTAPVRVPATLETDVLIVGGGPAGIAAALALAELGVRHVVITKHRSTTDTPRAHVVNQRTLEILRDLGVEREILASAVPLASVPDAVYCTSLSGEELGRVRTWGSHPEHAADYLTASPIQGVDLPQNLLEPVLVTRAAARGSHIRFDCAYEGLRQDADGVVVRARDRLTDNEITIRSRYVIGADGAHSKVAADLGLPFEGQADVAGSMNIVFRADLSRLVAHRPGLLYWVLRPGADVGGLGLGLVRMVRPWNEWLIVWGYDISRPPPHIDDTEATRIVHDLLGDRTIPVTIRSVSLWSNNKMYATRYTAGRVFCVGDAVHRHPPSNGLGANTAIQDSYNLAWKLAHVLRGTAGPGLLDTFDAERVPIGRQVALRANRSIEETSQIFSALGLEGASTAEDLARGLERWRAPDTRGTGFRDALRAALRLKEYEFAAHGVELSHRYRSRAVLGDGTPEPSFTRDPELFPQPSTWPGSRFPHAWLTDRAHQAVSTHDLAGKGRFSLFTGPGGQAWVSAATVAAEQLGIELAVFVVGPGADHQDAYGDWARLRGTAEDGCVLVRPDAHVAWRAQTLPDAPADAVTRALATVLARPIP